MSFHWIWYGVQIIFAYILCAAILSSSVSCLSGWNFNANLQYCLLESNSVASYGIPNIAYGSPLLSIVVLYDYSSLCCRRTLSLSSGSTVLRNKAASSNSQPLIPISSGVKNRTQRQPRRLTWKLLGRPRHYSRLEGMQKKTCRNSIWDFINP